MKPYYQRDGITIYHGDARDVLLDLPWFPMYDAIVTDPIWPNCEHIFPGVNAHELLASVLEVADAKRVIIHLGMNSDPRFLTAVPSRWPFIRTCYLAYVAVGYLGRLLRDAEIAYAFGEPPESIPGGRVLPGRGLAIEQATEEMKRTIVADVVATKSNGDKKWGHNRNGATADHLEHPTMRNLQHLDWLLKWWGGPRILDPFSGAGTTLVAAARKGVTATGIEINERYCEVAARRLEETLSSASLVSTEPITPAGGQS